MLQRNKPNRDSLTLRIEEPLPKSASLIPGIDRAPDGRWMLNRKETQLAFRNALRCVRDVRCRGRDRHVRRGYNLPLDAQIGLTGVVRTL